MYSIGIDSGSSTTKGVLFDGENLVMKLIEPTGANPRRTIEKIYKSLKGDLDVYTVTTGYGRDLLSASDKKVTEITCHGVGGAFLCPEAEGIIDIGGQDSKIILLDKDHNVKDFLMNDKCAAGTGRFLEVMMRILHQDIDDLDDYVDPKSTVTISSMCAVFAESEIISMLAEDKSGSDIAMGVVESMCKRTAIFAKRLPVERHLFFSGGLAKSKVIGNTLEEKLNLKITTHDLSQYVGAIGAAVIGYRKIK